MKNVSNAENSKLLLEAETAKENEPNQNNKRSMLPKFQINNHLRNRRIPGITSRKELKSVMSKQKPEPYL